MGHNYKKLSEYAKENSIVYRTAWNHYKQGKIPGAFVDHTGHIRVPVNTTHQGPKRAALYARVSTNDRKRSLDGQLERLKDFSFAQGYINTYVVKEVASGMNDNRKKLANLLSKNNWDVLVVENKDRLTRFGFNYIKQLLGKEKKEVIAINQKDDEKEDLIHDLVSIIYSFSARLYGIRRKKTKEEIVNFLGK